ncbi:MAG: iron-containing alcohol dehydrogenase [Spirochaeta sp.]
MDATYMHMTAEIHSGQGVHQEIGSCARQHGSRVLLISEPVMHSDGIIQKVQSELESKGLKCLVYDEVSAEDTYSSIKEALQLARAGKVQMVTAVGGMRVILAGRAVALSAGSGRELHELLENERIIKHSLPCLEIPTSYRNPLQFSNSTIVVEEGTRIPRVLPMPEGFLRCVLVDPSFTSALSAKYSAALMMDAVLNGMEGYLSPSAGYIGRPLLRDGVLYCSEALLGIYNSPDELRPRIKGCEGGLLTGLGLGFGTQGIGGALVYVMSSLYGVPKSWLATVLAPHIAEHWVPIAPQGLAEIAGAMGSDVANLSVTEAARQVPQAIRRMIGQTDLPGRLRDLDITMEHAKEAAELVMDMDMIRNSPRFPHLNDILNLVKRAY